ncbi:hypothetical protein KXD93_04930 [Mucilaginibacter sp. BJC16-A38]|uniref:hypothetical protein n=1 Tax=Mucilaginibacter phenanthrenivorans TaxID=1234842 RepID=UPI0021586E8B|nr:hypothetical protein [Mucilaginibacter phenanthrenivorans]MCR8556971.1 hypothetical protein [Mucilaginibacter phenanthrenivorans]
MAKNISLFEYKLELLKSELTAINESIRKLDDASLQIKNWTILMWAGSISLVLSSKEDDLRRLIFFTIIIPFLFWMVDTNSRRRQRHFIFRSNLITKHINSPSFETSFESKNLDGITVMNMMANDGESAEVIAFTSFRKIVWYASLRNFYMGLILITLALQVLLYPIASPKQAHTLSKNDTAIVFQQVEILNKLSILQHTMDSLNRQKQTLKKPQPLKNKP